MNADILVTGNDNLQRISQVGGLSGYGYQVLEAQTLAEAHTYLKMGARPKAIIINVKAVIAPAREFIQYARAVSQAVIIVVGADNDDERAAFAGCADVFLSRPVSLTQLIQTLQSVPA